MIRFIIRRKIKDQWNGLEEEVFETIDIDVPELEAALIGGGISENGYDIRVLLGCEILKD